MRHILLSGQFVVVMVAVLLGVSSCGPSKYNSDYNLNQAQLKQMAKGKSLTLAEGDTTTPNVDTKLPLDEEAEGQKEEKKKKKVSKRYFLGQKVSRGFVKSGGNGSRRTLETFSYLTTPEEPNPYAPEKYYYDSKSKKIVKRSGETDGSRYKVLHGPYQRKINDEIIDEGYFYIGTKHLRWEQYKADGTLVNKTHFEKGFLRDAKISYYNGDPNKIKEIIPYMYGEVQGMYYRFYENGQVEWVGQYEKGRQVGVWVKHFDFRNRRHYEFQYPKTAYEPVAAPLLIKEYDRHGTLIYEKDKMDKRSAQR